MAEVSVESQLTEEQKVFLSLCEEKFAERYTSKDAEFMAVYNKERSDPPIVPHWLSANRGRGNQRGHNRSRYNNRGRSDFRDRSENNRDRDNRRDGRRDRQSRNEAIPYYRDRRN